jgi:HAD superfamily hydrolase (TIGR01509 family)
MNPATLQQSDLAAVLFDMDGLLVDSEPQWFEAETRVIEKLGGTWGKKEQVDLLGSNLGVAARYMLEHTGSDQSIDEVISMLLDHMTEELSREVRFRPGALELVDALADSGIPMALVTSSVRVHVDVVLTHLPGDPFSHQVTANDVVMLKPHPEPYLKALELLDAPADRTIVLEDSPAGVTAAEAAGCYVLAVPSVVPIEEGRRRTVLPTLVGTDLRVLQAMLTPS